MVEKEVSDVDITSFFNYWNILLYLLFALGLLILFFYEYSNFKRKE